MGNLLRSSSCSLQVAHVCCINSGTTSSHSVRVSHNDCIRIFRCGSIIAAPVLQSYTRLWDWDSSEDRFYMAIASLRSLVSDITRTLMFSDGSPHRLSAFLLEMSGNIFQDFRFDRHLRSGYPPFWKIPFVWKWLLELSQHQ